MFEVQEPVEGVWAAIAPDTSGPAVSNATVVDLGNLTVVVDTFMTSDAASELRIEAERLTGRPPGLVINTHWHRDHVRGNRIFVGSPIVGTARMRELILADHASTDHPVVVPTMLIEDRLELVGERRATLHSPGSGHTESDVFVHLPDDRLVVAGDLVWNAVHPKTSDGFPARWAEVVQEIHAMDVRHVVPGHGSLGGPEILAPMVDYLGAVAEVVAAVRAGEVDAEGAHPPARFRDWADPSRFRSGVAALAERQAG